MHHTATKCLSADTIKLSMQRSWIENKGFSHIPTHYIVWCSGDLLQVNDDKIIVWATLNADANYNWIHIEIAWDFNTWNPTDQEYKTVKDLINKLSDQYPWIKVKKHSDFQAKNCPGKNFDTKKLMDLPDLVPWLDWEPILAKKDWIMYFIRFKSDHLTFKREQPFKLENTSFPNNIQIQKLINYAYAKWNNLDFVRTLDAENSSRDPTKQSDIINDKWQRETSYGICQLNVSTKWQWHDVFVSSESFKDPYNQIDYCRDVWIDAKNKWVMPFHAYTARNDRGSDVVLISLK